MPKIDPFYRFVSKLKFDPCTGCINWTGAKTAGQGHSVSYGSFWYEGKSWYAHRWAAKFIHKLDITDLQVDHMCRNTLCQQHLQAIPAAMNRELQWIRVQVGADEYTPDPFMHAGKELIPYCIEPEWLTKAKILYGINNTCSPPVLTLW